MNASYNISVYEKDVPKNNSEQEEDEMLIFKFEELYTLWFVPFCIIMVFGIIGNVITIAKIAHDKRLHNPTYCSICCLACADLIGLIHFLSHIFLQFGKLDIGHNMGKVFLAMCFATTHASASHVVLLWSLRYLVTIHPLWRLKGHRVIYGVESWNGVMEWSGVWSGVESTLYLCNLGRAFAVELTNES